MGDKVGTLKRSVAEVCSRASELTRAEAHEIREAIGFKKAERILAGMPDRRHVSPIEALHDAQFALNELSHHYAFQDDAPEFNVDGSGYEAIRIIDDAIAEHDSSPFCVDYSYGDDTVFLLDVARKCTILISQFDSGVNVEICHTDTTVGAISSCYASSEMLRSVI